MKKSVFNGKRVLLTGATGGLGKHISKLLIETGCDLLLTSSKREKLFELQSELREISVYLNTGGVVDICACDLNDRFQIDNLISVAGNIDVLINNAGMFSLKTIDEVDEEHLQKIMNINVLAPFTLIKSFLPYMVKNKWGKIVNIGSTSCYNGNFETIAYCMSKHAFLGMSKSLFEYGKENGVLVYNISPGSMQTDMGKEDYRYDFKNFIEPESIAEYVLFASSMEGNASIDEVRIERVVKK